MDILKIFIFLFALFVATQADQCKFQKGENLSPSQLMACFNMIALDNTVKNKTMNQLNNMIQFYSFTNLVNSSVPPYFVQVDLQKELGKIMEKEFQNDFLFHQEINQLFSS